jgi:hypothetical protein
VQVVPTGRLRPDWKETCNLMDMCGIRNICIGGTRGVHLSLKTPDADALTVFKAGITPASASGDNHQMPTL